MQKCNAVIFDALKQQWLSFQEPEKIFSCADHASILSILDSVESEIAVGKYAVGFVSYEAAPAFDSALTVHRNSGFPLLWFAVFDHAETTAVPAPAGSVLGVLPWTLSIDKNEYASALNKINKYIHQGDTYQVNFTFRMRTQFSYKPWDLFGRMIQAQGNGYGAYIEVEDWSVCSASPELFFSYSDATLISKPMKGTVPRAKQAGDDRKQALWLKNSPKNRAENLMIVDMVRNDLGHVARTGSVTTTSLFDIEKYPTVWQMTSTVEAGTDAGIGEIFTALFPAASITGAPKARTMKIICELEKEPRKIYTGCIGFFRPDRSAQFNVAIRTVLIDKKKHVAEYGVGGGIVWDSETENELDECFIKARVLTHVEPEFELLESILWTPEQGYYLLPFHLDRLSASAEYFSWELDIDRVRNKLEEATAGLNNERYKVRLRVTRSGEPLVDAVIVSSDMQGYRIHLARHAVDSENDLFLYHKTTRRQTYDNHMAEFPGYDDVLLFNEHRELTESCRANLVVETDNKMYTPPVSCGLLEGTYRRYLLEQDRIEERVIKLDELSDCSRIMLANSVRGLWEIKLETS